ncbi:carbohydrate ABC transporter substrate-binding protein (CUT1 family) [Isoptericola sp. CG 20/1183]|uniref:Carbohydrate ABC transporter substrate-binding protein (CUT1 family) n=1 Tax=Isoptericola halotolerans TaxID=300560 RepID=A0ABX5EER6_9MICO|nr:MULTISPECIES: extracellular solute-binding protein [Isoptericola]PRZ04825.1 carbohydrate ABC transporter substrate-binding protein (CUT1 family) [Isoptericola halotolerans]PRZ05316.1 carbohydrate ABC transporter substrate-binding protein (CUT1 family) [Isoptericola sp. CG 20/1183]
MATRHLIPGAAVTAAAALALSACGGGTDPGGSADDGEPSGEITVITQRTDIVDTVFMDYKERFEAEYPDVTVEFEALTDYEGEIAVRMNTADYGDVLLIPNSVTPDQLGTYFEPLGTVEELSEKYRLVEEKAYDGQGYGVSITVNTQGLVYNKKVWEAAGITDLPTTPDEFLDDLQAVADSTDAVPYYTNYADGWPLSQWDGNRGAMGDPEYQNTHVAHSDTPWAADEWHGISDGLLFDIVANGLSEEDPTTTNWEESKTLLGSGEVATMLLGSWAITQMQQAAEDAGASADDIGYMPFPYQVDGTFHAQVAGDYKNAINVNSEHKAAARAWIEWFAEESGYAYDEGGISPLVDGPAPETLGDFDAAGVEYVEMTPAPAGQEAYESEVVNTAEIDLYGNIYRQELVDVARGAADGDKESFFAELNQRWADARAAVGE